MTYIYCLLTVLLTSALMAPEAAAQTLGGQIVDSATRQPLARVTVRAFDPVADTMNAQQVETDSTGVFYLHLPRPGTYRIKLYLHANPPVPAETISVDSSDFLQRQYLLPAPTDPVFYDFHVDKRASPRSTPPLRYPPSLRESNIEGHVLVQFIVDREGRADLESIKVLRSNHALFTASAREALLTARYHPAERRGKFVRQVVQQPFNFCIGVCQ
jgi:TonB family protein